MRNGPVCRWVFSFQLNHETGVLECGSSNLRFNVLGRMERSVATISCVARSLNGESFHRSTHKACCMYETSLKWTSSSIAVICLFNRHLFGLAFGNEIALFLHHWKRLCCYVYVRVRMRYQFRSFCNCELYCVFFRFSDVHFICMNNSCELPYFVYLEMKLHSQCVVRARSPLPSSRTAIFLVVAPRGHVLNTILFHPFFFRPCPLRCFRLCKYVGGRHHSHGQ